jgi:ABC-type lipoprotein release transport system permease subunit
MKGVGAGLWIRLAWLFLVRSGRSTAALSVMVVTAVASLIFLSALAVGVKDAMLRNTVGLFSGHITGTALPASIAPKDLMVPGVEAVLKRIYVQGILSRNRLSQPLTLCGIDPTLETKHTALKQKISPGRYPAARQDEILISRDTAQIFSIRRGDRLHFTDPSTGQSMDLSVSGIYQTGLDTLDRRLAFCPLDRLTANCATWSAAVFLTTGADADTTIGMYRQQLKEPLRFESWASQMPDLRQLIDLEAVSMAIVIVLVFGVVAIGIACSFVIFIIRNMREYGILKAMGVGTGEMASLIVAKVLMMNLLASVVGSLIGVLAVWLTAQAGGIDISTFTSHNRYFTVSGIIVPRLNTFSLWAPPVTALCFSLLAAIWPAWLIARKKAADILRLV